MKLNRWWVACAAVAGLVLSSGSAQAQSIIREPMEHGHLEIDIHGTFGLDGFDGGGYGLGGGFRIGIPLVRMGPIRSINNSFALSVGADGLFWPDYYFGYNRFALQGHVDAQWNFYLTGKWSVFAEAGFAPYIFFNDCDGHCAIFAPWFDFAVGARYHFGGYSQYPALLMRLGSSGFNIGVSF